MNLMNFFNRFYNNNFMNLDSNIYLSDSGFRFMFNYFKNNYWNDWKGFGFYRVWGFINWDFFPAKEPYDIEV